VSWLDLVLMTEVFARLVELSRASAAASGRITPKVLVP